MTADAAAPAVSVLSVDDQAAYAVDLERWTELARQSLVHEGVGGVAELSLTFVSAERMAELHHDHLGGDGPTDVLAFPLDADDDELAPVRLLGDVVVCPEVAARQAESRDGTVEDEIALLVVHGVLHVLGHDHAEPAETELMRTRERELLGRFHLADHTGAT